MQIRAHFFRSFLYLCVENAKLQRAVGNNGARMNSEKSGISSGFCKRKDEFFWILMMHFNQNEMHFIKNQMTEE